MRDACQRCDLILLSLNFGAQNKFDSTIYYYYKLLFPVSTGSVNSYAMEDDSHRNAVETLEVEDEEHRQARIRMLREPG